MGYTKVVLVCENCRIAYPTFPSQAKLGRKYCSEECFQEARDKNRVWRYKQIKRADGKGSVALHRALMEAHLGRKLERWEHVHHKDENKDNNDISNLEVLASREHARRHWRPTTPSGRIPKR